MMTKFIIQNIYSVISIKNFKIQMLIIWYYLSFK